MKIWAIGDLHLSHSENVDKPMGIFGQGWENHDKRLYEAWLECVEEDDIVMIPGDISWALRLEDAIPDFEWLHSLPGTKLISKGNHDLWWNRINYLNSLYDDIRFLQNDCYYVEQNNIVVVATRGWPYPGSIEYSQHDAKIYRREMLRLKMGLDKAVKLNKVDERLVVSLHYPPTDATGKSTEFTDVLEEYGVSDCVYGHLHGGQAFLSAVRGEHRGVKYHLVSLDYLESRPKLIIEGE